MLPKLDHQEKDKEVVALKWPGQFDSLVKLPHVQTKQDPGKIAVASDRLVKENGWKEPDTSLSSKYPEFAPIETTTRKYSRASKSYSRKSSKAIPENPSFEKQEMDPFTSIFPRDPPQPLYSKPPAQRNQKRPSVISFDHLLTNPNKSANTNITPTSSQSPSRQTSMYSPMTAGLIHPLLSSISEKKPFDISPVTTAKTEKPSTRNYSQTHTITSLSQSESYPFSLKPRSSNISRNTHSRTHRSSIDQESILELSESALKKHLSETRKSEHDKDIHVQELDIRLQICNLTYSEKQFERELTQLMKQSDEKDKRSKALYRRIYSKKHRALQKRISEIVEQRSLEKSFNERHNQLQAYLNASRGKNLFLETPTSDYDPWPRTSEARI